MSASYFSSVDKFRQSRKTGGERTSDGYALKQGSEQLAATAKMANKDPAKFEEILADQIAFMEQMAREKGNDAELGHYTRLAPQPASTYGSAWYAIEAVAVIWYALAAVGGLLEVFNVWNQGAVDWRIYVGITALVATVMWLLGMFAAYNDKQNEDFMSKKMEEVLKGDLQILEQQTTSLTINLQSSSKYKDSVKLYATNRPGVDTYRDALEQLHGAIDAGNLKLPRPNLPGCRFGLTYLTTQMAALIIIWSYEFLFLKDNGTDLATYNLYRTHRVYLWLFILVLLVDLWVRITNYFDFIVVGMTYRAAAEKVCSQLSLEVEAMLHAATYPRIHRFTVLMQFMEMVTVVGVSIIIYDHITMLTVWNPTSAGVILNYYELQTLYFVESMWCYSITVLSFLCMVWGWSHPCAARHMAYSALYWLILGSAFIMDWALLLKGFNNNHDGLLSDSDKYAYENLLWLGLVFNSFHAYFVVWKQLRQHLHSAIRMAWCPKVLHF